MQVISGDMMVMMAKFIQKSVHAANQDATRFCNIPRFYQILGEFFCFCFAYVD
jgi:hypothetical protein